MLRHNVLGQAFDDALPAFFYTDSPKLVFNRLDKRMYGMRRLLELAKEKGHRWQPNEFGAVPRSFAAANPMPFDSTRPAVPPELVE